MEKSCKHPCCGSVCRRPRPKKLRKPIRKVSRKRVKDNKTYSELRKKFLIENETCQFPACQKLATDVHHAKGRGVYFLDVKTWKALCREHHDRIELNPVLGKQLGLSESRLALSQ